MDNTDKILVVIVIALSTLMAGLIGWETGQKSVRKEALLKSHAYYQADSDGNAKFTWR